MRALKSQRHHKIILIKNTFYSFALLGLVEVGIRGLGLGELGSRELGSERLGVRSGGGVGEVRVGSWGWG